jgi:folate-binding Fe-S cluster repair protein YgfZ
MNDQNVYILEDRGILYINGTDTKEFLQNLITNDINKVTETNSCFASLLTPQGKFLFAFIIVKHKSGYFIDCEKSQIDGLFKQLSVYKLRSNVEIMNLSNEFVVAAFNRNKFLKFEGCER